MGVLDAAECKPTFGVSPKLVQGLVAGGRRAVTGSVEGAEDSVRNAERDLRERKLARNDVVAGVLAGGGAPHVLGAVRLSRKRGAAAVAVTSCWRGCPVRTERSVKSAQGAGEHGGRG